MRYLAIVLCLGFAPAPLPNRSKPIVNPPHPVPGHYTMTWGPSIDGDCELLSYSTGWYMYNGCRYWFVWQYDGSNRIFTMWEALDGNGGREKMMGAKLDRMCRYDFVLDEKLQHQPESEYDIRLELKRRR